MIVLLVPAIVFISFIVISYYMYKYQVDLYTNGNNTEKGFVLLKINEWEK